MKKIDKNKDKKERFLEYFAEVPIQKYAGAYIGVDETTIIAWKKADPNFSNRIERAKADYIKRELKMVRSREWKLERLFKDNFAQRTELTGKDGNDLVPRPILGSEPPKKLETVTDNKLLEGKIE